MEVNARVGGATASILNGATDYDIVEESAKAALGIEIRRQIEFKRAACFRSLPFPAGPVRLEHQADAETVKRNMKGIRFLRQRFSTGTVLHQQNPGLQSAGIVSTFLVVGNNLSECIERSARVEKALELKWRPVQQETPPAPKPHVLLIDRVGFANYRRSDASPYIDPKLYDITLVCQPERKGEIRAGEVARLLPADLTDETTIESVARKIHALKPVDKVCAFSEAQILVAARLRDSFGLTKGGEEAALRWRDKLVMKTTLARANVRVPAFAPAHRESLRSFVAKLGKAVVKPIRGSGSKGLHFISSLAQANALADCLGSELEQYGVEEHIEGALFHIDGVVQNGSLVWAEVTRYGNPPFCFQWNEPNFAHSADKDRLYKYNEDVLGALELKDGVFHHECFLTNSGEIIFCEIAARAGGNGIIPYLEHFRGINLYEAMFDVQLARPVKSARDASTKICGYIGVPLESGTVLSMPDEHDALLPGVARYLPLVKPGTACEKSKYSGQASAIFVFEVESVRDANDTVMAVRKMAELKIRYSKENFEQKENTR